jgi:hypothetical protein
MIEVEYWHLYSIIGILLSLAGLWEFRQYKKGKYCPHGKTHEVNIYGLWEWGRGVTTFEQCWDCRRYLRRVKFDPDPDAAMLKEIDEREGYHKYNMEDLQ